MRILETLAVKLVGDTKAFASAMSDADKTWSETRSKLDNSAKWMKSTGKTMSLAVTAPVAGAGLAILNLAGDFEASMNRVEALTGLVGDTSGVFDQLKQQARDLGATTQFSASEAADAMGFLAMAGFDANEIMGAMPGTLQLAAAAGVDLGRAADIASNILSGFGMETEQLAHANDVLVKAMSSSNVDLGMLGESMKYAAPFASALGVEFEELAAMVGLMGNAGIQGSQAGTALRGAMARLAKPTGEVTQALERLGVNVMDSQGKMLPFADILGQLEAAGATATDMMTIFGLEAGPAMQAVLGQGSDALSQFTQDLRDSGGTAATIAEANMRGLNGQWKEMQSAVEELGLAIADSGLLEFVTDLLRHGASLIRQLSKTNPQLLKWGTIIAGVAATIGPLLTVLGSMASGISAIMGLVGGAAGLTTLLGGLGGALALLTGPLALVIGAVAALAIAWSTDFLGIRTKTQEFWTWITGQWPGWMGNLKDGWQGFSEWWQSDTQTKWRTLKDGWGEFTGWLQNNTRGGLATVKGHWETHRGEVEAIQRNQWDNVRNLVEMQMTGVQGAVTAGMQFMRGDWEGGMGTLRDTADSMWGNIQNIFSNQLDTIRNLFAFFGWREVGENIASGLADGISAGARWIIDAATRAARAAMDAAKSWLGIHSPADRAADEIGEPWTEGVGVGAVKAMPRVSNRIQDALGSMMDGIAPPPMQMAGAGVGGPVQITVRIENARDYNEAYRASHDGVRAALRAAGLS